MALTLGTVAPVGFADFPQGSWLSLMRQFGCQVVQVYRNAAANVGVSQMIDYVAAGEMPCDSLHGIFGEQYDPSSPDEQARQFAMDTYKREGDIALELGGSLVVVHCSTVRREGISTDERQVRLEQLVRSMRELGAHGRRLGLTYAFENLPAYHPIGHDASELAGLLEQAGSGGIGMCVDTGHANMTSDGASAIRSAGGRIAYIHFSDNDGQADQHLMPGQGSLDLPALATSIAEVGYGGTIMLEVFHDCERMTKLLEAGWRGRLADFMRVAGGRS